MRKPARSLGALAAVVAIVAIASNALWEQEGSHPAPIWGGAEPEDGPRLVAAHSPSNGGTVGAVASEEPDPMVRRVQMGLIEVGYFSGEADGILTDETRESIELFETDRGLPATGEPSVALLAAFTDSAVTIDDSEPLTVASVSETERAVPATPVPVISTVAQIQAALNKAGLGPLTVDGVMGPRTRTALDTFALANGLSADGVTPAVLRALAEATR